MEERKQRKGLKGVVPPEKNEKSDGVSIGSTNGGATHFAYDLAGNRTSVADPLGRQTFFTFDVLNRLVSETDPLGGTTRYGYDATGNRLFVADALGQTTRYSFDPLHRLIEQADPLGHAAIFAYDAAGNLIQSTDRNGRVRTYAYDALDRRVAENWLDGGNVVRTFQYVYDAVGNLLSVADPDSQYAMSYDALDRVASVDNAGTPNVPRTLLSYAYDAQGNVLSVADQAGFRVESQYDTHGLLARRTWQGPAMPGVRVDIAYDAAGRRTELRRFGDPAGTSLVGTTSYGYDLVSRLADLVHRDGAGNVLASYHYGWDLAGQLASESDNGQASGYQYDRTGQLTDAAHTAQANENYSYDANGNRTSGGTVVGPDNRILQDSRFAYTYDNEGNLVRKTEIATAIVTAFTYDFRNRLINVEERTASGIILHMTTYTYDVFDQRIAKTVDGNKTTTVYEGRQTWADFIGTSAVVARYLHGPVVDEMLARFRPADMLAFYLTDRLGTVRDLVNAAGNVINHIDYNAFGKVILQTNSAFGDRFLFTGREFDAETGLYFYNARYYDTSLGRFISQDPQQFAAGDINLYRYVQNNPVNFTDPTGKGEEAGLLKRIGAAIVRGGKAVGRFVLCVIRYLAYDRFFNGPPSFQQYPVVLIRAIIFCIFGRRRPRQIEGAPTPAPQPQPG